MRNNSFYNLQFELITYWFTKKKKKEFAKQILIFFSKLQYCFMLNYSECFSPFTRNFFAHVYVVPNWSLKPTFLTVSLLILSCVSVTNEIIKRTLIIFIFYNLDVIFLFIVNWNYSLIFHLHHLHFYHYLHIRYLSPSSSYHSFSCIIIVIINQKLSPHNL